MGRSSLLHCGTWYFSQALFEPCAVGIPLPIPCQRNHIHWLQSHARFWSQPFWWGGEKGHLKRMLAAQPSRADSVGAPGITGMMVKPPCDKWGLPHQAASKGFLFYKVSIICRAGKAGGAPSCWNFLKRWKRVCVVFLLSKMQLLCKFTVLLSKIKNEMSRTFSKYPWRIQPTAYDCVQWGHCLVLPLSFKKKKSIQSFQKTEADVCNLSFISVSKKWTVMLWFSY